MSEWNNPYENLPKIDYENQISWADVFVKIHGKETEIKCLYRHIDRFYDNIEIRTGIFYLLDGTTFAGVEAWRYATEENHE